MASCKINITGTSGSVRIRYTLASIINIIEANIGDPVYIDSSATLITYTTLSGTAIAASTCITITNLYPGTNPCLTCGCNDITAGTCIEPVYTDTGCPETIATRCVELDGIDIPCMVIAKPITLRGVIDKIVLYTKNTFNRLTATDNSIIITPVVDSCTDKISIKVNVDPNITNALLLRTTGLFVATVVPGGGSISNTPLAVIDTNSIDFTASGLDNHTLTGVVKRDPLSVNKIKETVNGLLVKDTELTDVTDNLIQHLIFEAPVMNQLSFTDGLGAHSLTVLGILSGTAYASNITNPNADVKILWGNSPLYENTFNNNLGVGTSLTHDYISVKPYSNDISIKGYNTSFITKLSSNINTVIPSGLRAIRGAERITEINYLGFNLGTTGIYDFKGFYNLNTFQLTILDTFAVNYQGVSPAIKLENTYDLQSLTFFRVGNIPNLKTDTPLVFSNPLFNDFSLDNSKIEKGISIKDKTTPLSVSSFAGSTTYLDLSGSLLNNLVLFNCGSSTLSYINNIVLKLKQDPYILNSGVFDFSGFKTMTINSINGKLMLTDTYTVTPTKILFPDFTTQLLDYFSIEQDIIKNEAFISFNNNALDNGRVILNHQSSARTFGQNYEQNYYNPAWAPLNGFSAVITTNITTGIVTNIYADASSYGYGYNTIPVITTVGPGSGLVSNGVMYFNQNAPISNGGTGYTVGQSFVLTGGIFITPVLINVTSIGIGGAVTSFTVIVLGEYTSLPATLTHSGGLIINTTNMWSFLRANITAGGTGYDATTKFKLEITTGGGTGTGTASSTAKAAIESLHTKGWQLKW